MDGFFCDFFLDQSSLLLRDSFLYSFFFKASIQLKTQSVMDEYEFWKITIHTCHRGLAFDNSEFS